MPHSSLRRLHLLHWPVYGAEVEKYQGSMTRDEAIRKKRYAAAIKWSLG